MKCSRVLEAANTAFRFGILALSCSSAAMALYRDRRRIRHPFLAVAPVLLVLGLAQGASAADVNAVWNSATDIPVTADGYTATGNTVSFTLNFAPPTGTDLTVVKNTALDFISGTLDNLAQGQAVALSYGGVTYRLVANYYGGSGNDLVLVWASRRAFAWGRNSDAQLGDNTTSNRYAPTAVTTSLSLSNFDSGRPGVYVSALSGKTVQALAGGSYHSLGLCSDGTVASWGNNEGGRLGIGGTASTIVGPRPVDTVPGRSALSGKTVVAIAAGWSHSLALCTDGTVASWGNNDWGQLGNNSLAPAPLPVAVNTAPGASALYGKTVIAVAAGRLHSLALCSDGTVAAWGYNFYGQLGNNSSTDSRVPVAVDTSPGVSALNGKTVVAVAAGTLHSLALCSDGTVAAWGNNSQGQLGDNTTASRKVPIAVNTNSGVSYLYGRPVGAIAAGSQHSLALCTDGTVAAWGDNQYTQLGDNSSNDRYAPVAVNTDAGISVLYNKAVVAIAAGSIHSVALCSDGTIATWGFNVSGQLGDNTTASHRVPVAVDNSALGSGQRFTGVFSGSEVAVSLALVAAPPALPITLTGPRKTTAGPFACDFTNTPGAFFSVLAATNPALPWSNWTPLTGLTEVLPGEFQFVDPEATNSPQRYYRVRSP